MPQKPQILDRHIVTQSRLFTVEAMNLRFSNGVERQYERLVPGGSGAVMMVPINEKGEVLLIREYGAGLEDYNLTLPKGAVDLGESLEQAANRELQEEIQFAAKELHFLKHLSLSPSYMKSGIDVFIALDLYEAALSGDEPEPLEVVPWPLNDIDALVQRADMTEGRAIAALYLAKNWFQTQQNNIDK
ncbi:ADP compounds hydrolase NudE [Oceaniserpentilla sp. 4NH20-0058]|uniref:ADP compounds hydrolase NudE n=1 Tax=Oceaniserpentilla sp. 4NH20-0058 TaxID=3127660 RepID=UPI0031087A58